MIIEGILDVILDGVALLFAWLPDTTAFQIPAEVGDYAEKIFEFVGWIMPYSLYSPLLFFIISFTVFRVGYAIVCKIREFI